MKCRTRLLYLMKRLGGASGPRGPAADGVVHSFDHSPMSATHMQTKSLNLVPRSLQDVHAMVEAMSPSEKAELSADWLARLHASTSADPWTHGFSLVHRETGVAVGGCAFKGPPAADGVVEIAYGVNPDQQG
jgi:RimJ/RimL family protein N-acetyltransferase